MKRINKTIEPKTFDKEKGLKIAISLIHEFVALDALSNTERDTLSKSILILEKVISTKVDIPKVSRAVEVKYVECPICNCNLREKNYKKHMSKAHTEQKNPNKTKTAGKKIDMLDSWAMLPGSFGSGKRR